MLKIRGHIPVLDGIRGLAILMVIVHHTTILKSHSFFGKLFLQAAHLGGYGVDLFFVLSGFLITGILMDSKGTAHFFRNFYGRRTLRIFPLYYGFITLVIFILPTFIPFLKHSPYNMDSVRLLWPWYYFYLSNFLVAYKGFFAHGGIDITWSLAIEEHFYLIWPLLIYYLDRTKIVRWLFAILATTILFRCLLWARGAAPIQVYVLTFTHLDGISMGALLAALVRMQNPPDKIIRLLSSRRNLFLSFMGMSFLCAAGFLNPGSNFLNTVGFFCFAIFFTQLLATALSAPDSSVLVKLLSNRFLVFAGKYSYAMYLFHLPIGTALRRLSTSVPALHGLGVVTFQGQCFYYAAVIGLTVLAAFASWHLLEKHMLALKKFFAPEMITPRQKPVD